ncbi:hypothetical protein F4553_001784 [Allocatelliglobosispora scoriae]|uniref:Uncharacterized protein n=1 Tax=Allocatelliglobosispora scoriae TaxID=643052 RepID=A0A841BLA1_9ACTN|nr:hypothetical protein [Allocatelliglobosispora scoriae]MBB5868405.1 hypothetical protein [Allocatelliglobosispora scoriae]
MPSDDDLCRGYTVHITFEARDVTEARDRAVMYAEALCLLRPEVSLLDTRLSPAEVWHRTEPTFCGQEGPEGELCTDVHRHPGFHSGPGLGSLSWGEGI